MSGARYLSRWALLACVLRRSIDRDRMHGSMDLRMAVSVGVAGSEVDNQYGRPRTSQRDCVRDRRPMWQYVIVKSIVKGSRVWFYH